MVDDFGNRSRPEGRRGMIQGALLDLSGVFYIGEDRLPGAQEALRRLAPEGIPFAAVTNTTRTPRAGILKKLQRLGRGFPATPVFTAPMAACAYLDAHGLSPLLLIHPALRVEFADRPRRPADSVLVGDTGQGFAYGRLNNAFRLLMTEHRCSPWGALDIIGTPVG